MGHATASNQIAGVRETGAVCPVCDCEVSLGEGVAICNACGAVHHRSCWDRRSGCGSYTCSSGRTDLAGRAALVVTRDELAAAVPLPKKSAPTVLGPGWVRPVPEPPRTSKLAVASFICALVGIPAFGLVTGLLAIVLAALGLLNTVGTRLRGAGWATAGLVIGIADVLGWAYFLFPLLAEHTPRRIAEFAPDQAALEGLDPAINRAMRANVVIETSESGMFGRTGIGSGVILKIERGEALIVTNRHVVDLDFADGRDGRTVEKLRETPIRVQILGQPFDRGRVVWVAPAGIDAALVRAPCWTHDAEAAVWSKDLTLHVGDPVFAIGNPQNLTWTHTQGTISQFRVQGSGAGRIRIVQTQTAINPGNSGGGLYTKSGELIGINTWTSDKRESEGLSFAISFDSILERSPPDVPEQSRPAAAEAKASGQPAKEPIGDKTKAVKPASGRTAEKEP